MKNNKIVQKYLLSPVALYLDGIIIAVFTWCMDVNMVNEYGHGLKTIKTKFGKNINFGFSYGITAAVLSLIIISVLKDKKDADKFAISAAQAYIKHAIKEHPEFKYFETVLSNPDAMKNLATHISNNLDQHAQENVLKIGQSLPAKPTKYEFGKAFLNIKKIIEEHIKSHPEFMESIYFDLACGNNFLYQQAKQMAVTGKEK